MKSPRALAGVAALLGLAVLVIWLATRSMATPGTGGAPDQPRVTDATGAATADPGGTALATGSPVGDDTSADESESPRTALDPDAGPLFTVGGRVLFEPAAPIQGAEVVAYRGRPGESANLMGTLSLAQRRGVTEADVPFLTTGKVIARAEVDENGGFELQTHEQHLRLRIEHDFYGLSVPEIVHVPANGRRVDVVLDPYLGGMLEGRLLGDGSDRVRQVELITEPDPMSAVRDPSAFVGAILRASVPNDSPVESGRFTFRAVLPDTQLTLLAEGDGVTGRARQPGLAPGERREAALALQQSQSLVVHVVDEDGAPVAMAHVRARSAESSGMIGQRTGAAHGFTDEDGKVTLLGMTPGEHRVRATKRSYIDARHETTVPTEDPVQLVLRRGGSVSGIVVDREGKPIAGARVAPIESIDVPVLGDLTSEIGLDVLSRVADNGAETDADGNFVVHGIEGDAPFHVVAAHEDYSPGMQTDVTAGDSDIRIELVPQAAVTVRVVREEDDTPLTTFALTVRTRMFLFLERSVRDEQFTAVEDGTVRIDGLPPGSYSLAANAEGRSESTTSITLVAGEVVDAGELRLAPAASIAGRVVDEAGRPVAGALVKRSRGGLIDNPALAMLQGGVDTVRSDDRGQFVIAGLSPGRVQLVANAEGFASARSERLRLEAGDDLTGVEIVLGHGGSVQGRLTVAPGEHPEDFSILVQNELTQHATGSTPDQGGAFRVDNLDPGRYQVQAMHPSVMQLMRQANDEQPTPGRGFDIKGMISKVTESVVSQRCTVQNGEVTMVELDASELGSGVRLLLRVEIAGQPLDVGIVEATQVEDGRVRTGFLDDGTVSFGALRPGPVRVQVRSGLTLTPVGSTQTVTIPDGTDAHAATIELPGGSLAGRVTSQESGEPLAAVLVRLIRAADGGDDMLGMAITDADGRFTFRALEPGSYCLVAADALVQRNAGGTASRVDDIDIRAGEHREGIELRAQPAVGATVTVTDEANNPVPGAMLVAVDEEGRPVGNFAIAVAGQDGRAHLGGLPRGRLRVVGRAPGYAPDASDAVEVLPGQSVDLRLQLYRGTRVVLEAVGRDGLQLAGADVRARCNGGQWIPGMLLMEGRGAGGRIDLGRLAPGDWEFRVEHPGTGSFSVRRSISDGATVTILATPN